MGSGKLQGTKKVLWEYVYWNYFKCVSKWKLLAAFISSCGPCVAMFRVSQDKHMAPGSSKEFLWSCKGAADFKSRVASFT
jgi:hypothetical protein